MKEEIEELSVVVQKILSRWILVPMMRTSILSLFWIRKLFENQDFLLAIRDKGGNEGGGRFGGQVKQDVIYIAMEMDVKFMENLTKRKQIDRKKKGP